MRFLYSAFVTVGKARLVGEARPFCIRDASVQVPLERIKTIVLKLDLASLGYFIGQYEVVIETGLCPGEARIAGPYLVISLDHFDKKLRKDKKERAFAACDGLRDTLTAPHVFGKIRLSWRRRVYD